MPHLRYALPPSGQMLETLWSPRADGITVRWQGRTLARLEDARALEEGAKVSLPDGSVLKLWFKRGKLTVARDEKLLVSGDEWEIKYAFLFGYLTALVNLLVWSGGLPEGWSTVLNKMFGVILSGPALKATLAEMVTQATSAGALNLAYGALLLVTGGLWMAFRSTSALLVAFTAVMFASAATLRRVAMTPGQGAEVILALFLMLLFRFVCLAGIVEALRASARAGRMVAHVR